MALQVWLPLNGNLNNQGLSNYQVTNTNAIINTNGKIGECYQFGTGQSYLELPKECMRNLSTECTVSFWIKFITRNSSYETYFQAGLGGSAWNDYVFGLLRNSNGNSCCFTISNGSSASNASYTTPNLTELNTWYHITLVYKTGHCLVYINGELYQDYTTTIIPAFDKITTITIGCSNTKTTYQTNCLINDFRIYDTALSPREVKEISKGLVCHYPLNRGGFGGENLLKNSHHKCDNNGYYVGTYAFADSSKLETGKTYTLSFNGELQDDTQTGWYFNIFPSPYTAIINKPTDKEGRFAFSFVMPENGGNRASIGCYSLPLGNRLGCAIWDVKLEEGSTATPWTPAPSDALYSQMGLDNNIEYDVSGYGNNGTSIGTLTYSSDTPRYNVSTHFTGTNYISLPSPSNEVKTISLWAKWDVIPSGQSVIFVDYKSKLGLGLMSTGILCGTSGVGSFYTYSKSSIVANKWYHFVIVNNGEVTGTARKLYIDGVEQTPTSNTSNWTYGVQELQIGKRSTTSDGFVGCISDFRAYNTVLSADDILELYHTPITLSNNGTLLTQGEYMEV